MAPRRRGQKPQGPFEDKQRTIATRVTEETRELLDAAAAASGRSLSQEIEIRLVGSFRDPREKKARELAFGDPDRAGAASFLNEIIREGGGSRALQEISTFINIPDVRTDLAKPLIFDFGYDGRDSIRAAVAAKWREYFGPAIAVQLVAEYHRLVAEAEAEAEREPPAADPAILADWLAIAGPIARQADEELRAALEARMRERAARLQRLSDEK